MTIATVMEAQSPIRPAHRPDVRLRRVLDILRDRIVTGAYPPGSRLPTRLELTHELDSATITIQKAMDQLARDGFVVARGRAGSFVTDHPPHLRQFGLVLPGTPGPTSPVELSPFWRGLHRQAQRVEERDSRIRWRCYFGAAAGPLGADYRKLVEDVAARRLAGLVLTMPWSSREWLPTRDLPCVGFGEQDPRLLSELRDFRSVSLSMQQWRDRALDLLAERGVQRLAWLAGHEGPDFYDSLAEAGARRGIRIKPGWVLGLNLAKPHWAANAVAAMFNAADAQRPQTLVVSDDSLAPIAVEALRNHVPGGTDVSVIAHANFPLGPDDRLAAIRLGFSIPQVLDVCMRTILARRRGESPPPIIRIQPLLESELDREGFPLVQPRQPWPA